MNAALNISEQKEVEMGLHFYARVTNVIFYYFICCMEKWRFVDYLFMSIQINFPSRFKKFSFSALCTSFRVIFFDSYPVVMGPQTVLIFVGTLELMSLCLMSVFSDSCFWQTPCLKCILVGQSVSLESVKCEPESESKVFKSKKKDLYTCII